MPPCQTIAFASETPRVPPAEMALGLPTGVFRHTRVSDIDEQAAIITAWYQEYAQLKGGSFSGGIDEIWLGAAQFFLETTSHALCQTCTPWPGAFWFGIPRPGSPGGHINATPLSDDTIAVHSGGKVFELYTPDTFSILGLVVDEAELRRHAVLADCPELPDKLRTAEAFRLQAADKALLWRCFSHTLAELLRCGDPLSENASRLLAEELVSALVSVLAKSAAPRMPRQSRVRHRQVVLRAKEYVLSGTDRVISINDLCSYLHVSRRTLQNCFHEILGVCPTVYLKAMRLNAVRRALKSAAGRQTVQDIAATWGFWHMSQFAADYRRLFSERPSETLRAN